MLEWTLIRGTMVAFFILANSFFVAAEFALVSIRETRVQQLIALGRPGARTVLQLKRAMDDFLPAVQFGVTLAALALGWIGEPALAEILTRIATHVLAFEGDSEVRWFEGNFSDYEADRKKRLGVDADQPHRLRYQPLVRD